MMANLEPVLNLPENMVIESEGNSVTFLFPTTQEAEKFFELWKTADYCGIKLAIVKE